jgi:hypothetical protein
VLRKFWTHRDLCAKDKTYLVRMCKNNAVYRRATNAPLVARRARARDASASATARASIPWPPLSSSAAVPLRDRRGISDIAPKHPQLKNPRYTWP